MRQAAQGDHGAGPSQIPLNRNIRSIRPRVRPITEPAKFARSATSGNPAMKAYLLDTGRRVSPFDEPVGEMRVHNRRLREHQTEILASLGCEVRVIDDPRDERETPCLLIYDDVY